MAQTGDNNKRFPRRSDHLLSALCYSLWHDRAAAFAPTAFEERSANRAVRFAVSQFEAMPDVFRIPVRTVLALLDLHAFARFRRSYTALDHSRRFAILNIWRTSAIKPCRDVVQLFDALVLFQMSSEAESHDESI